MHRQTHLARDRYLSPPGGLEAPTANRFQRGGIEVRARGVLHDRFDDLVDRYGRKSEKGRARIEQNRRVMEELEVKIFGRLPFGPDALQGWNP